MQVEAAACQRLAALAAAGAGGGRAPGTLPAAPLLPMDSSPGTAPPAARCLVSGAALPKPLRVLGGEEVLVWHGDRASPQLCAYLRGEVDAGTPLLAKLHSSEIMDPLPLLLGFTAKFVALSAPKPLTPLALSHGARVDLCAGITPPHCFNDLC